VLLSELLAGSTIAIPTQVTQILDLLKLAQQIMFGLFLAAIVLATVLLIAATPLVPRSRLWSIPAGILALAAAVCVTGATVLATVMSVGAKIALTSVDALNISADIGAPMFAFMWLSTFFIDIAAIFHIAMACFCAPYREKLGLQHGSQLGSQQGSQQDVAMAERDRENGALAKEEGAGAGGFGKRPMLPDFFIKRRRKNGASTTTTAPGATTDADAAHGDGVVASSS
jgi:hypothetical protein